MIVETIIASIAAVTIAGTWLGLRFTERAIAPQRFTTEEQAQALKDVERWMAGGDRTRVRALLLCRPHALPPDARRRVEAWVQGKKTSIPYDDAQPEESPPC